MEQGKNFVMLGAAGFVAPRHMAAIKAVGGNLLAVMDPHDSVGILDSYFPECELFTRFEEFNEFCWDHEIDYVSICTPNHLHAAHCRFALSIGANAICEKPLVLSIAELDKLAEIEASQGIQPLGSPWYEEQYPGMGGLVGYIKSCRIYTIMQLRLDPVISAFKPQDSIEFAELRYRAPRGRWFHSAWKTGEHRSGGLAFNIGIHGIDLLCQKLGAFHHVEKIYRADAEKLTGTLRFFKSLARGSDGLVPVHFSIDIEPGIPRRKIIFWDADCSYITCDLSSNITSLHTKSYEEILAGRGFGIEDARPSIEVCERIREACTKT